MTDEHEFRLWQTTLSESALFYSANSILTFEDLHTVALNQVTS
jgi:hypothetical protein